MGLWDWIVVAVVGGGTVALVLAALGRRAGGHYLPRGKGRPLVDDADGVDGEDESESPSPRRARRRQVSRTRSGEMSLRVVPLSASARNRYLRQWRHLRAEFVEEPNRTTERTDEVVQDLMFDRGFPVEALEDPDLLIAPDHQVVVENYRIAHRLAAGAPRANTEQLRLAMLHFRVVLEELLEDPPFDLAAPKRKIRRKRKSALPQPDVDRYRINVTDQGPEPPEAPTGGRAAS
jgi:hypothetical protein